MSAMLREAGLLKELAEAKERIRQLESERVPEGWMHDRIQVNSLITHLEGVAYQCDADGEVECVNQAAAMSLDVLRLVLLPMLAAAPQPKKEGE